MLLCYKEKAPNAWQRRGTQKTRNTYNQPNRLNRQTSQTKHNWLCCCRNNWCGSATPVGSFMRTVHGFLRNMHAISSCWSSLFFRSNLRSKRARPQLRHTDEHALTIRPCNCPVIANSLTYSWSSGRRTRSKLTPSTEGLGFDSACPPKFPTQLHVTSSLSTGGGPMNYVQLSEGG